MPPIRHFPSVTTPAAVAGQRLPDPISGRRRCSRTALRLARTRPSHRSKNPRPVATVPKTAGTLTIERAVDEGLPSGPRDREVQAERLLGGAAAAPVWTSASPEKRSGGARGAQTRRHDPFWAPECGRAHRAPPGKRLLITPKLSREQHLAAQGAGQISRRPRRERAFGRASGRMRWAVCATGRAYVCGREAQ